ncbi:MAG TPA: hypothetical protein PKJ14_01800 [Candidatus Cloacimonadota bacterium]|nr:hypothetical protein [Candidatus Cloacimonadota bacterium]HQL14407.1 hypothetical protein [Candidatus Cloacimonadota bacterium]
MFDFLLTTYIDKDLNQFQDPSQDKKKYLKNIKYSSFIHKSEHIMLIGYSHPEEENDFYEDGQIVILKVGLIYPTIKSIDSYQINSEITLFQIKQIFTQKKTEINQYIKGNFVLVILDKAELKIYGFIGKSGLIKLFYHVLEDELLLSTSIDSIARFPGVANKTNYIAVLESLRFGYPLGSQTFLENIHCLNNHSYLEYSIPEKKLNIVRYYSYNSLLMEKPKYDWNQTYELTPGIFNQIVDFYINNDNKINAALTSGFDSRTVLSRTYRQKDRIRYYSWAATNRSIDVKIPQLIAKKMDLNYSWLKFSEEFLENYDFYAKQLMFFSDGLGNIKRCNQMFSHEALSQNSRINITGYIGSELLRPTNSLNSNIFPAMKDIIYNKQIDKDKLVLALRGNQSLLTDSCISNIFDNTLEHVYNELKYYMCFDSAYLNLYNYTLSQSLWKYFGQEFHSTRIYDLTLSPYADDEFIEFIIKTPVPTINKHAFKRNAKDLRKGQLFYIPILAKNCPPLLYIITSRGYTPAQLKSHFYPLNFIIPYLIFRFNNKVINKTSTFNALLWNQRSYDKNYQIIEYNDNNLLKLNRDNVNNHEFSIKLWLMKYS